MNVSRLDHLVLTVREIERTCQFYGNVLGMKVVTSDTGRVSLHFGQQKINLHLAGKEFEPKALQATPGSGDLCFITDEEMGKVVEHVRSCGVEIIEGPVTRTGALGPIQSIYIRDPDGNLVEISRY